MDVDLLSTEKRDEAMRKGLCSGCGKHGHLSRDGPDKKKTTRAYMDDEEKERFYDKAEKEGF